MIKPKTVLTGLLLGFAFISCNKNKIVGEWHGTQDNTCPDRMFSNGIKTVDFKFDAKGKFRWEYTGSNGENDNLVTMLDTNSYMAYEIIGDSLVISNDIGPTRFAQLIKFESRDNLILTREYTDTLGGKTSNCKVVTKLHRKSSTNG